MTRRAGWAALVVIAAIFAFAPLPAPAVERWYSRGIFPILQGALTSASNVAPFALFDVLWVGALAVAAIAVRRVRASGWRRGLPGLAAALARSAVVVYLLFLLAWGMNYRRVPLVEKLVFDSRAVTGAALVRLGDRAVATLNSLYAGAHAAPVSLEALAAAFQDAHRALGGRPIVTGRPKPTLLGWYFHKASIAGMTDPFFLETMLAPDLLDVERPFVIAHEWGHLAGYADESEANFVAYLACQRGDASAQYSAALMLIGYTGSARALKALDLGPSSDLLAIQTRYAQTSGPLRFAARESYDKFLKANRVERGIESYDAVVQLILGTQLDAAGIPRLR